MQLPEVVRTVSVRGKGDSMERKSVLDFVLADKSSATQVSFWGNVVERHYSALQQAFDAEEEGAVPKLHLIGVEVVAAIRIKSYAHTQTPKHITHRSYDRKVGDSSSPTCGAPHYHELSRHFGYHCSVGRDFGWHCCASLALKKRVIFYFVQAKAGEGGRNGSVWIFPDAWLCELEEVEESPTINQLLELKP